MEQKKYLISDAAKQVQVESHVLRYWEEELELPVQRNKLGHRYYTTEDVNRLKRIKAMKEQGFQLKAIRTALKREIEAEAKKAAKAESQADGKVQGTTGEKPPETMGEFMVRNAETTEEMPMGEPEKTEAQANILAGGEKWMKTQESAAGKKQSHITATAKPAQATAKQKMRTASKQIAQTMEKQKTQTAVGAEAPAPEGKEAMEGTSVSQLPTTEGIVEASGEITVQASEQDKADKVLRLQMLLKNMMREAVQEGNEEFCNNIRESVLKELDYQFRLQEEREEVRETDRCKREEAHYRQIDELLRDKSTKKEKRKKHSFF